MHAVYLEMNYKSYFPAIEAGRAFLQEIGEESFIDFLDNAIMATMPAGELCDYSWHPLYDHYMKNLVPHKVAVYNAGMRMYDLGMTSTYRISKEDNKHLWMLRMISHDVSKFSVRETGYLNMGKGEEGSVFGTFHEAWGRHQGSNHHHPESCYRMGRDGLLAQVLPMQSNDVTEMIADWQGAGESYGDGTWLPYVRKNLAQWKWHGETLRHLKIDLSKLGVHLSWDWIDKDTISDVIIIENVDPSWITCSERKPRLKENVSDEVLVRNVETGQTGLGTWAASLNPNYHKDCKPQWLVSGNIYFEPTHWKYVE